MTYHNQTQCQVSFGKSQDFILVKDQSTYSDIPLLETNSRPTRSWTSFRKRHLVGWKFALRSCALFATIVLIVNISLLITSVTKYAADGEANKAWTRLLFEGSCSKTRTYNILLHLFINGASTILLASSNYCMQCLSAPTRKEIDRAHAREKWLDIGTVSIRNLGRVHGKKATLWIILAISSLPIHLL